MHNTVDCDVLVVGAGFSGVYGIYKFKELGLNVKCFEAGEAFGGVWHWNRYPGARVDSEVPFYQLSIPEIYNTYKWSERFPDHRELRQYFEYADQTLGLRKDVYFNAKVNSCYWDKENKIWTVKAEAGHVASCKYLFLATGVQYRRHYPDFAGITDYKGILHHSAAWPKDLSANGKKVAIIGAGATAVQLTQELAKEADALTIFMRRPSYCQPTQQRQITEAEQRQLKAYYKSILEAGRKSASGFPVTRNEKTFWATPEDERVKHWEEAWARGGFNFNLTNFGEVPFDAKANRVVYDFWRSKVHRRMRNKEKAEMMAPAEMPYYFGTKRTPMEGDYYEMLDRDNVSIVHLGKTPLKTFNETGVLLNDGTQKDFDIIILATGFDSFSGSMTTMGLTSKDGVDMQGIWDKSIATYLGMMVHGFPNCFTVYGPQAPTAFSNAPTIIECQTDFVADLIARAESEGVRSVEATAAAQKEWTALVEKMCENTLLPLTDSWWNGGNIPGKKRQMLTFPAGIDVYEQMIRQKLVDWEGFTLTKETAS